MCKDWNRTKFCRRELTQEPVSKTFTSLYWWFVYFGMLTTYGLFPLSDPYSHSDLDSDSKPYGCIVLCRTCFQWLGFRLRPLSQKGTVPILGMDLLPKDRSLSPLHTFQSGDQSPSPNQSKNPVWYSNPCPSPNLNLNPSPAVGISHYNNKLAN